jgi:hypothetical protein
MDSFFETSVGKGVRQIAREKWRTGQKPGPDGYYAVEVEFFSELSLSPYIIKVYDGKVPPVIKVLLFPFQNFQNSWYGTKLRPYRPVGAFSSI